MNPKRYVLFLLLALLLALLFCSQEGASQPAPQSLSELQQALTAAIAEEPVAGLMLCVATRDSILFSGGFGYADVAAQRPVTSQTRFRMGSITKMLVALGIQQLVAEGQLQLHTPLRELAPEVPFQNHWVTTHPLRVIHLLEHTSGFDDMQLNKLYSSQPQPMSGLEGVQLHEVSLHCRWRPGERMAYSNPNYNILGYLIEKRSGQPYERYLQTLLLDPLGMSQSDFSLSRLRPTDTKEYQVAEGRLQEIPSVHLLGGPQGALWSCADDMSRLLQLYLRGGPPLFGDTLVAAMERPRSSLAARAGFESGYACGNHASLLFGELPFRGHRGLMGACHAGFFYNRELDIGFVIASNTDRSNRRLEGLVLQYLEGLRSQRPLRYLPLDEQALEGYLGHYELGSPRNAIAAFRDRLQKTPRIFVAQGKLFYQDFGGPARELLQTGPMTFSRSELNLPMYFFTENEAGEKVLIKGDEYYEQVSTAWVYGSKGVLALALLLIVLALPTALWALVGLIRRRMSWGELGRRCLPLAAMAALTWGLLPLIAVQTNTYLLSELGALNGRTLRIFLGTLLFALISLMTLYSAISQGRKTASGAFRWYYLACSFALLLIVVILGANGWIGLRTWAL
ncbi:MAG: serine hydrolase domain-containing protein [Bacteroidota bacterium]